MPPLSKLFGALSRCHGRDLVPATWMMAMWRWRILMRDYWRMSDKTLRYNGKPTGGKGENDCASVGGFQKMRYYTCKVSRESPAPQRQRFQATRDSGQHTTKMALFFFWTFHFAFVLIMSHLHLLFICITERGFLGIGRCFLYWCRSIVFTSRNYSLLFLFIVSCNVTSGSRLLNTLFCRLSTLFTIENKCIT